MSIETELQNVVAAASALNQTVRGQIDQINATVGSASAGAVAAFYESIALREFNLNLF